MSVIDASVMVVGLVLPERLKPGAREALDRRLHVPAIFPAEVTAGLRKLVLRRVLTQESAADARLRLRNARLRLHPFRFYEGRVWELCDNLTVYDAWYVAIAERLDQPLVTADAGILSAPGLRCELIDARSG